MPSKLESEEKDANKTSKKADKVKTGEMLGDNSQSSHSHNREQWKRKLQPGSLASPTAMARKKRRKASLSWLSWIKIPLLSNN